MDEEIYELMSFRFLNQQISNLKNNKRTTGVEL